MDILQFGDLHIGAGCDEDIRVAALGVARKAYEEIHTDLIIVTGDVYDGVTEPEHRNLAKDIIQDLAATAPVYIIKGNHDIPKDLLILASLRADHQIIVFERPKTMVVNVGRVAIHIMPHFSKAQWIAARLGNDSLSDVNKTVSQMALNYLRGMIASNPAEIHLLYGHLTMAGSKVENHQPLLGEGITFSYFDLVEAGFSGGGFGHIHLHQAFGCRDVPGPEGKGSPEFRYSGSMAALNYGESALNKCFLVFNTDTLKFKEYPIKSIQRLTFDGVWNGNLELMIPIDSLITGSRIRIKLLVDEGYSSEDGRNAVKQYLDPMNPLELKIEIQTKPKDQVRAATIAAAKSACQKMEAYWAATASEPPEPMRSDMISATAEIEAECLTE
jgi:DNA repair exonuclease SbcCD nuclease subunit